MREKRVQGQKLGCKCGRRDNTRLFLYRDSCNSTERERKNAQYYKQTVRRIPQADYDREHGRFLTPDGLRLICSACNYDPTEIGKIMLENFAKLQASGAVHTYDRKSDPEVEENKN